MGCNASVSMAVARTNLGKANGVAGKESLFNTDEKKIILKTWKLLSNDLPGRGARIFLRIFDTNPHVKELFPCRDLEGDELLRDPNFKGHASRFMQAVGAVMDNMDDYETSLSPLLNGLGRQHIHFRGFKPSYFDAFESNIMHIWTVDLGPKFTDQARSAWLKVFAFLLTELKQGYSDALKDAGLKRPVWMDEDERAARERASGRDRIRVRPDTKVNERQSSIVGQTSLDINSENVGPLAVNN